MMMAKPKWRRCNSRFIVCPNAPAAGFAPHGARAPVRKMRCLPRDPLPRGSASIVASWRAIGVSARRDPENQPAMGVPADSPRPSPYVRHEIKYSAGTPDLRLLVYFRRTHGMPPLITSVSARSPSLHSEANHENYSNGHSRTGNDELGWGSMRADRGAEERDPPGCSRRNRLPEQGWN